MNNKQHMKYRCETTTVMIEPIETIYTNDEELLARYLSEGYVIVGLYASGYILSK